MSTGCITIAKRPRQRGMVMVLALILLAVLRDEVMSGIQVAGAALVIGAVVWSQRLRTA
jgi:drug/metabolite transporter (DMT)-like permease